MTLKLSLIGYGKHATKRIIPALKNQSNLILSSIISRKNYRKTHKGIKLYNSIGELKKNHYPDFFYICTPIKIHISNIKEIIKKFPKTNIICEKSITDDYSQTKYIIDHCKKNKIFLFESYMYKYHPHFKKLEKIVKSTNYENDNLNLNIKCRYTIPKLDPNNHRNKSGPFYDIGCYPISVIYFLFKIKTTRNLKIKKIKVSKNWTFIKFAKNNHIFSLSWGYGLNYKHYFWAKIGNLKICTNKIFTKDSDFKPLIELSRNKKNKKIKCEKGDNFIYMFDYIYKNYLNEIKRNLFYNEINEISLLMQHIKKLIKTRAYKFK